MNSFLRRLRLFNLSLSLPLFFLFCLINPIAWSQQQNQRTNAIIAGVVDLGAVISFHPAMRNFDYHSGRFIVRIPATPSPGGMKGWEMNKDERRKIANLESLIEKQIEKVNEELMRRAVSSATVDSSKKPGNGPEYERLVKLHKQHKEALAKLADKIMGGVPDSSFGDLPSKELQRIFGEIQSAIQTSAKANGAAIVLNSPGVSLKEAILRDIPAKPKSQDSEVLEKWQIKNLFDLESLAHLSSGSSPLPIAKSLPPQDKTKVCGGHFESIQDPAFLKVLFNEYLQNKKIFSQPFNSFGINRTLLAGSIPLIEKNLTMDVVSRIFDLYQTRKLERDAAFAVLREAMGM